ncbi:hypothetical protein TNIN_123341 [Trichonephila inaurata madagascariensis]|uniref:Uncharacterized protein n=1 Tax=Trichonephila inaurata madagascariensis TaxID=2747483 RepID=A0A8X6IX49_9ARAC|nr:hypothetical protein TNIN_123341 [Trichonephila inaurata madagascariensis]
MLSINNSDGDLSVVAVRERLDSGVRLRLASSATIERLPFTYLWRMCCCGREPRRSEKPAQPLKITRLRKCSVAPLFYIYTEGSRTSYVE